MTTKFVDVAVIGAGPAGMAAALAAVEAGAKEVLLIERLEEPGGILQQCIHNGFGLRYFKEELTGPEYAHRFIERVRTTPEIALKTWTTVIQLTPDLTLTTLSSEDGFTNYHAKAIVLAMGCRERARGAINIPGTRPAGIYTAGLVQRMMNIEGYLPGHRAVILGSGDIGLIMARRLTLEGVKVSAVLELMSYSHGLTRNIVQCLEDFKIPLLLSHTVMEIQGKHRLEGIVACPVDKEFNRMEKGKFSMDCNLLVLSVGLIPENELSLMAGIAIDPMTGGPWIDSHCQTNISGIFACGNVAHVHDLVDDVSEESWTAGKAAASMALQGSVGENSRTIDIDRGENIRSVVPQKILRSCETPLYIRPSRPMRDAELSVGSSYQKLRVVNPGETIRFTVNPIEIGDETDKLHIRLSEAK